MSPRILPSCLSDPRQIRWVAAGAAGILYGCWALLQNAGEDPGRLAVICLAQFAVSFLATMFLSAMILRLIGVRQTTLAALAVASQVLALYAVALIAVHLAVQTPNFMPTVTPIIAIAGAYAYWFAFRTIAANAVAIEARDPPA